MQKQSSQVVACIQVMRSSPGAQHQRGSNRPLCFSPGIDKENVELSPTTGHCNSGRTRHGSASQVQKQRSTGSFKRNSIKKIVWSLLSFLVQGDLTSTGSSLVTPSPPCCDAAPHFCKEPVCPSAMLPGDPFLEALPKLNAAFSLTSFLLLLVCLFKQVFRTASKKVGGQDTCTESIPVWERMGPHCYCWPAVTAICTELCLLFPSSCKVKC